MALFKGKRDDERVAAAGDALLAGKVAKGVGGQGSIDGDLGNISHKGALGKTTHGLAGERRIPIANITAVRMKEPGMTNGYIAFKVMGNIDRGGGVTDDAK